MKNSFRISVKEPCSENFESFKATPNGGFCGSCEKEVIDFTRLSDEELIEYFNTSSNETCGRFKKTQLKSYEPMITKTSNQSFVSRGIAVMSFSLLSLCAINTMQAQDTASNSESTQKELTMTLGTPMVIGDVMIENYRVSGTVLDEENLPLPGVNVVLKGTAEGTQTDFDGKFEFPRALEIDDVLVFSYIGYGKKEYTITESASETIDITIQFDLSDVELMGEIVVGGAYKTKRNIFQKFIALFK